MFQLTLGNLEWLKITVFIAPKKKKENKFLTLSNTWFFVTFYHDLLELLSIGCWSSQFLYIHYFLCDMKVIRSPKLVKIEKPELGLFTVSMFGLILRAIMIAIMPSNHMQNIEKIECRFWEKLNFLPKVYDSVLLLSRDQHPSQDIGQSNQESISWKWWTRINRMNKFNMVPK